MIYEVRTYTLQPGTVAWFMQMSRPGSSSRAPQPWQDRAWGPARSDRGRRVGPARAPDGPLSAKQLDSSRPSA